MKKKWKKTGELIREYRLKLYPIPTQKELTNMVMGESDYGQFFWNIEKGLAGLPPKHILMTSKILKITPEILINALVEDYRQSLVDFIREAQEERIQEIING